MITLTIRLRKKKFPMIMKPIKKIIQYGLAHFKGIWSMLVVWAARNMKFSHPLPTAMTKRDASA